MYAQPGGLDHANVSAMVKSSMLFECVPHPTSPMSTLSLPDVIHMISLPRSQSEAKTFPMFHRSSVSI